MKSRILFEKVIGTKQQIKILYELLSHREHNISHDDMPDLDTHKKFVKNNPYKAWFIASENKKPIGSFYIKFDNSIGLNLKDQKIDNIRDIIEFIKYNFEPEDSSPSMTPKYFYLNTSYCNMDLKGILEQLNIKAFQISYKI